MDLQIEIDSDVFDQRQIRSKSGEFTVFEQSAWMRLPDDRYPQKCKVRLVNENSAYKPGKYSIDAASFFVDRFGNIQLKKTVILTPA